MVVGRGRTLKPLLGRLHGLLSLVNPHNAAACAPSRPLAAPSAIPPSPARAGPANLRDSLPGSFQTLLRSREDCSSEARIATTSLCLVATGPLRSTGEETRTATAPFQARAKTHSSARWRIGRNVRTAPPGQAMGIRRQLVAAAKASPRNGILHAPVAQPKALGTPAGDRANRDCQPGLRDRHLDHQRTNTFQNENLPGWATTGLVAGETVGRGEIQCVFTSFQKLDGSPQPAAAP